MTWPSYRRKAIHGRGPVKTVDFEIFRSIRLARGSPLWPLHDRERAGAAQT